MFHWHSSGTPDPPCLGSLDLLGITEHRTTGNVHGQHLARTARRDGTAVAPCHQAVPPDGLRSPHAFEEFALPQFSDRAKADALALVRDDAVWSQLAPCGPDAPEPFALWRFHFRAGADNSGFVGWLATHLKSRFGTGVFVVCGQNSADGGIFDYWGCPWELREDVIAEVRELAA